MTKYGILVDLVKVETLVDWPRLKTVQEIKSFFSLIGYYRRFVKEFFCISIPFKKLTKNDEKFIWTSECEVSFQKLKEKLVLAPILIIPSGTGDFVIYSDASLKKLGCVLMQNIRVVAYALCQLKDY